jgi:hypothetical protein
VHPLRVLLDIVSLGEWRGSLHLPRVAAPEADRGLWLRSLTWALIAIVLRDALADDAVVLVEPGYAGPTIIRRRNRADFLQTNTSARPC